jgi:hypothetical protein
MSAAAGHLDARESHRETADRPGKPPSSMSKSAKTHLASAAHGMILTS